MSKTLYEKIWDQHLVYDHPEETALLYIDFHLIHEVTSPQAFDGLKSRQIKIRQPKKMLAVMDHSVPTKNQLLEIADPIARDQVKKLSENCKANNIELFSLGDIRQGIIHVIAPEQGVTQPGMTIVCGDSHTSTHGAFGALAFGIGTSEVEHVMATQCLQQKKSKTFLASFIGKRPQHITAKD